MFIIYSTINNVKGMKCLTSYMYNSTNIHRARDILDIHTYVEIQLETKISSIIWDSSITSFSSF